ncbi:MAG TPA: NADP-dependent oxidoreductase [Acidimicrobiales bacterium]|nr:NADP-dependent oxidoreductase [Acidimicrobiales bacterium]
MRAIAVEDFQIGPVLTEQPDPVPGTGEVLVRVAAASLNNFDLVVAAGYIQGIMEHRFPVILGVDFAGTVAGVGEGAGRFSVGDQVFGCAVKPFVGAGSLADLVTVDESYGVAARPDDLDPATAGAAGLAGATALTCMAAVDLNAGETVLVSGATGGVGSLAVQLCLAAGADVIATATPGPRTDFVRRLGATRIVDYGADVAGQVRELAPGGVDAVFHLAGDWALLADLLRPGGRIASPLGIGPDQLGGRDAEAFPIVADVSPAVLDRVGAAAATGALQVPVSGTWPLDDALAAMAAFRAGKVGKLAVTMG